MWLLIKRLTNTATNQESNKKNNGISGTQQDMLDLLTNKPWLILLGMGFFNHDVQWYKIWCYRLLF